MIISDYISLNANKYDDEEAIVYINSHGERTCLTWKEVSICTDNISTMLKEKGISKGDKVAIVLPNSLIWLPIYFGILKLGAVVVPINYRNGIENIYYCIELVECKAIFVDESVKLDRKLLNFESLGIIVVDKKGTCLNQIVVSDFVESHKITMSDDDVAAIYFSSGTTGKEKAVVHSHKALQTVAEIELSHHRQIKEDRFLCLAPLHHTGAIVHWFGNLLVGGTVVIMEPISPVKIMNVIEQEKITITWFLVSHIQDILDAIELKDIDISKMDLSKFRLMHSGAQPVPAMLIYKWRKIFPKIMYDTNYGLTEAGGPGCIHLGVENFDKVGSIGKPDSRWSVKISNDSCNEAKIGELVVAGPSIMMGYYNDKKATQNVIKDGWLHTGDLAYIDEEGFIYLVGRIKDMIICNGENIYPIQIENHIRLLESVKDVAIIGIPNKRMGEIVVAVVERVPESTCSKKDIYKHCEVLPVYQRPLNVYFEPVKRNAIGKIDKRIMRQEIMRKYNFAEL